MRTEALEAAYRATTYRVFLPGGSVDLRIGQASPELAVWLAGQGTTTWALITACNPESRRLDERENAARQSRLEVSLLEAGHEPYAGENLPDDHGWPAEESCFVAGVSVQYSMEIAARFGQNALVCGGADGVPQLLWVDKSPT